MSKRFIDDATLSLLRRQLARSTEPWGHRGCVLTVHEQAFGEVRDIADARLIVDLHNNALALLNEVTWLRNENESLWKLNREMINKDPALKRRGRKLA